MFCLSSCFLQILYQKPRTRCPLDDMLFTLHIFLFCPGADFKGPDRGCSCCGLSHLTVSHYSYLTTFKTNRRHNSSLFLLSLRMCFFFNHLSNKHDENFMKVDKALPLSFKFQSWVEGSEIIFQGEKSVSLHLLPWRLTLSWAFNIKPPHRWANRDSGHRQHKAVQRDVPSCKIQESFLTSINELQAWG